MITAAAPKNGLKNIATGNKILYGIFVVALCVVNVITNWFTLNPWLAWTRDDPSLGELEFYYDMPTLSASTSSLSSSPLPSPLRSHSSSSLSRLQSPQQMPSRMVRSTNRHISRADFSQLDRSDPIFQRIYWDNDPVVIEKYKLLFFTVPKNSCTEWKRLFRRMMNYSNWNLVSPHNPDSNGLRYLGHYSNRQQIEFMTSPNWTRAIFVREPMERLLSGFLEKAYGPDPYILRHCCGNQMVTPLQRYTGNDIYRRQCQVLYQLGRNGTQPTPQDFPFQTFVEAFMVRCKDPHWLPQSNRLRPRNWQHINFVGHFDTLEEDARSLLEKIGAWQNYGVTGWGIHGNLSMFQRNLARHSTSAKSQQNEFYTPQVLDRVLAYLKPDYDHILFNFTRPNMTTNML
jgi:hypothetical protein